MEVMVVVQSGTLHHALRVRLKRRVPVLAHSPSFFNLRQELQPCAQTNEKVNGEPQAHQRREPRAPQEV
jgi:hypothetical protein